MMLLVNSNFDNTSIPIVKQLFNGKFADFSDLWYIKLGGFYSQTILIVGLAPLIELALELVMIKVKFYSDSGRLAYPSDKKISTKASTTQKLINSYAGPSMLFHYRYAFMMISIFTTMLFGVGIPILFPICLLNLCVQYVVDRIMTVYIYQEPPMFDSELTNTSLWFLQYAGALYLAFGFWMLSNKQIFSNEVHPIKYVGDISFTGHTIGRLNLHQASIVVLLVALCVIIYLVWLFLKYTVEAMCFSSSVEEELLGVEDLFNFYDSLHLQDLQFLIDEEMVLRQKYVSFCII
jgi:hypothetical protein